MSAAGRSLARVALFVALSSGWMLVVAAAAGIALGGRVPDQAGPLALGAGLAGALTLGQSMGLVGLAVLRWRADPVAPGGLRVGLAIGPHRASVGALALGGGALVGILPAYLAGHLLRLLPEGAASAVEVLPELLAGASGPGLAVFAFTVVVGAPLGEELVFRGYLWSVLGRGLPGWAAWLGSSALFLAYHLDPVQSVALIPTALFLGWLRWRSGSVVPAVLAHVAHNGSQVLWLFATAGSPAPVPPMAAVASAGATVLVCVLVARDRGNLPGSDSAS